MKALTVRQPWAFAIASGQKKIENRTWPTSHRGGLAIHAGSSWSDLRGRSLEIWREVIADLPAFETLPFGQIVCVVNVVDCVPLEKVQGQPFAEGPWCWILEDVRVISPGITWRGSQGLFSVPDEVIQKAMDYPEARQGRCIQSGR